MVTEENLKENIEYVKENIEKDLHMQKVREEVIKKLSQYRTKMEYLAADAPISILCLPPVIEGILLSNGMLRVYDVFNVDFTEIKGLGEARIRNLTTRLDEFFSML